MIQKKNINTYVMRPSPLRATRAYTLVEILIAAGIFSMFCVAVFAMYRSGAQMFSSGSWKVNKQKEAERFLSVIRERLEQASDPYQMKSNGKMVTTTAPVFMINSSVALPSKPTRLMLFTVCKPDMSSVQPGSTGLILYHSLMTTKADAKGFFEVHFYGNTNPIAGALDFFNSNVVFKPNPSVFANFLTAFSAPPSRFSLGSVPFARKISDVKSFSIDYAQTTATGSAHVANISITMVHPKHPNTTVTQSVSAKIESSLIVNRLTPGGF